MLTGLDPTLSGFPLISKLFHNDGGGQFSENTAAGLAPVCNSDAAWGDYNSDGFLDLLLVGDGEGVQSKVYHNNGDGTFTDVNAALTGAASGGAAWGDYDNDGLLDIITSGCTDFVLGQCPAILTKIYHNDGNGVFSAISADIPGGNWAGSPGATMTTTGGLIFLSTAIMALRR